MPVRIQIFELPIGVVFYVALIDPNPVYIVVQKERVLNDQRRGNHPCYDGIVATVVAIFIVGIQPVIVNTIHRS